MIGETNITAVVYNIAIYDNFYLQFLPNRKRIFAFCLKFDFNNLKYIAEFKAKFLFYLCNQTD